MELEAAVDLVLDCALEDSGSEAADRVVVVKATEDLNLRAARIGGGGEGIDVGPEDVELGTRVGGLVGVVLLAIAAGDAIAAFLPLLDSFPSLFDGRKPAPGDFLRILGLGIRRDLVGGGGGIH